MRERLDVLLVDRHFVESRTKAQWLVRNGFVMVDGKEIKKPGKLIDNSLEITLLKEYPYVGKGGIKLEAAIRDFSVSVEGKVCADIGASVGGFTDCLLKHGADKVYAIDTARDLLHPSLLCKDHIIKLLGVDARTLEKLDEEVDILTIDITFASLKDILPKCKDLVKRDGDIIALVKPLFETEYHDEPKFIIIQDPEQLREILLNLLNWSINNNFFPKNLIKSPILGKGGSIEFFIHYRTDGETIGFDYRALVNEIIR